MSTIQIDRGSEQHAAQAFIPFPDLPRTGGASVTSVTGHNHPVPGTEAADFSFPTDYLPPMLAEVVRTTARITRVPECLPGCCALATISAAIGRGLAISGASHKGTRGNLYFVVAARSGSGKSLCFDALLAPFFDFERRLVAHWRDNTRPRLLATKEVADIKIRKLKRQAATLEEDAALQRLGQELTAAIEEKEKLQAGLAEPALRCEDATDEQIAVLLAQNQETLFSASADAGAVLDVLLGRYNRNCTDESVYLKAYSGDHCRVDRVNRARVVLEDPCLTVLWVVQPHRLDALFGKQTLSDGGLLPRILICGAETEPAPLDRSVDVAAREVQLRWRQSWAAHAGSDSWWNLLPLEPGGRNH